MSSAGLPADAQVRRVGEQRDAVERVLALVPRQRPSPPDRRRRRFPAPCRACGWRGGSRVAPCAARLATTARAAPPAPSTRIGPLSGRQCGLRVAQALDEAVAVVVEAGERAVLLDDDGVDRADPAREVVDAIDQRHDRLLVRRGDVAAAQAQRRQAPHRRFELLGRHREQHVAPRQCRTARASDCG